MDAGRWEYSARDCIDCSCSKNLGWKMLETGVGFFGAPVRDCNPCLEKALELLRDSAIGGFSA